MHSHSSPARREPVATKVPEKIIALFWVVKLLTTAGGEAASDYLALKGYVLAGVVEVAIFLVALWLQFRTRRYVTFAYWFLALAIAIFGTGVADAMHLIIGIPYAGTTFLWAVVLAVIFWLWYRSEGTLSIHSITTRRRELYYWATVFATFALGTALGDFTAYSLHLGYLTSAFLFLVIILIPAVAWRLGLNSVVAFWFAYVITRPLGASFADYFSKPHALSGINFGDGPTALVALVAIVILVAYLAITRADMYPATASRQAPARTQRPSAPGPHGRDRAQRPAPPSYRDRRPAWPQDRRGGVPPAVEPEYSYLYRPEDNDGH
ncbi:MAG: hypothetical protein ACLPUO_06460 [Streptosporangiaceae bacterium]